MTKSAAMHALLGGISRWQRRPPLADASFGYLGELHGKRGRYFYLSGRAAF